MTKTWTYPRYMKCKDGLKAFIAPDKMFLIRNIGTNMNPGVSIDHYITRRMVLKHATDGDLITKDEFERLYNQLFSLTLKFML